MEALIGIVLVFLVATYAWEHYHDWVVALVAIAIIVPIGGFFLGVISDRAKAEKARQEKTAADLLAAQRMLSAIISESRRAVAELPDLTRGAEKWCNQAEFEFREGAFAPFWDAIETATFNLRTFERNIQILESKAQEYRSQGDLVSRLNGQRSPFEIGIETVPYPTHISDRIQTLYRLAHKEPIFATIYQQRQTNQLLKLGFATLGEAIYGLSDRLETSVNGLGERLEASLGRFASETSTGIKEIGDHIQRESQSRRGHEHKEQEMLDNIQRRRKPLV